jgi:hypothetical protein
MHLAMNRSSRVTHEIKGLVDIPSLLVSDSTADPWRECGAMLDFDFIDWDETEGGNVEHIAAAGLTREEVEEVLYDPGTVQDVSRSSGRPVAFGYTTTEKYIIVVYRLDSEEGVTVLTPIAAYEVPKPE